ncbi:MAG: A24 family peptidase [Candidatus Nanoarchaeia archaeon]|nr:A24 family peptidase [Candidatus Nanoarchaeia archaeon]
MIDYFLIIVAFIFVTIATIFDIKTREVPDWLSFSFIAIALFSNLLFSLVFNQWNYIIYSLIGLVISFIFGCIMYYSRQWGGGDTKLLIGLCTLLPIYPQELLNYFNPNMNLPFLFILLLNILLVGGVYGLLFSIILAIKNRNKFSKEFKILFNKSIKSTLNYIYFKYAILLIILLFVLLLIQNYLFALLFFIFMVLIIFVYIFIKSVENSSMYKYIDYRKLTEGDWVVNPIKVGKKLVYEPNPLGISKSDVIKLKKLKIKNILVKEGLPFLPAFWFGLIITIIYGNLFLILI